jgi:hypothetical protein
MLLVTLILNSIARLLREFSFSFLQEDLNSFIQVDPHVLATPVIADLNMDGIKEEMIIPVSYFFDVHEYE